MSDIRKPHKPADEITPKSGEPIGMEETRVFRSQYFAGKTREEIAALMKTSKNPYFLRAGNEELAALETQGSVDSTHGELQQTMDGQTRPAVPEDPSIKETVTIGTTTTAKEALTVLKKAGKRKRKAEKRKQEAPSVFIADREIKDPEKAYETFRQALNFVRNQLPSFLKFEVDQLQFQKLAGEVVGKSEAKGETIDPIMLLHPVMRLATVIFHEMLHNKNRVPNEGVVHTMAELYCGKIDTPESYNQAVDKFMKLASIYGKGKIANGANDIYKLYYNASAKNKPEYYKTIHQRFLKQAKKQKAFESEEAANQFFGEVFPELKIVPAAVVATETGVEGSVTGTPMSTKTSVSEGPESNGSIN
jgi:hypothetical protein